MAEPHSVEQIADLLVEAANGKLERADALTWLMHDKQGRSLFNHLNKKKDEPMRNEQLASIAKDFGVVKLAKFICDQGAYGISEKELSAMILDHAIKSKRAGESDHQAFARVYSANDDEGLLLRNAIAVTKATTRPAPAPANEAYQRLMKMAEQRRTPGMTIEQAFAKVYQENAELAEQERSENRPRVRYR
jgi:hypothetical protein